MKIANKVVVGDYYPLAPGEGSRINRTAHRVKATGEFRPPKAGEWYLSGAIVEGYEAFADLSNSYHIGKLVKGETVSYWRPIR